VIYHSQLIMTSIAGLFCAAMGVISLYQGPHRRANRSAAGMLFAVAAWNLSGYAILLEHEDHVLLAFRVFQLASLPFLVSLVTLIQELLGLYSQRLHTRLRRACGATRLRSFRSSSRL